MILDSFPPTTLHAEADLDQAQPRHAFLRNFEYLLSFWFTIMYLLKNQLSLIIGVGELLLEGGDDTDFTY